MIQAKKITVSNVITINKKELITNLEDVRKQFTWVLSGENNDFLSYEEDDDNIYLPQNSWWDIESEEIIDERCYPTFNPPFFSKKLREDQVPASEAFTNTKNGITRSGILQARPRFGKTVVACDIISKTPTNTLIIVKDKLSFFQWISEIKAFLNYDAGTIGAGYFKLRPITVCIYKSLRGDKLEAVKNYFGMMIIDEVHNCPANMYFNYISKINTRIRIGISGTPSRKDGKHIIFPYFFTPYIFKVNSDKLRTYYQLIDTNFEFNIVDFARDWANSLTKLVMNDNYLAMLAKYLNQDIANGRVPLVKITRVDALEKLQKLVPRSVVMTGSTADVRRREILDNMGIHYNAILTTTLFDEAVTCKYLDTLYICQPTNNEAKLEQLCGRIQNDYEGRKNKPLIRDFQLKGFFVARQQLNRVNYYINNNYTEILSTADNVYEFI